MSGSKTMAQWQFTWIKAVAEAWRSPEFAQKLKDDPHTTLKEKFGFIIPEGQHLRVEDAPPCSGGSSHADRSVEEGTLFQTIAYLPTRPEDDEQAIAIANLAEEVAQACCGHPCC